MNTKPHTLIVAIDCEACAAADPTEHCSPRCLGYTFGSCPYTREERLENTVAPCGAFLECDDGPVPPPWPEPVTIGYGRGMGGTGYAWGSDIIAVAAWRAYWQAYDEHGEEHPHGWAPNGDCWVITGDHDMPEAAEAIPTEPGTYLVNVDVEGWFDDSALILTLWDEARVVVA